MMDVSKVITVGDVSLYQQGDVLQVRVHGQQAWWLTKHQFADFAQAAQLYIERNAEVE
jgi:hypothetical protein